MPFPVSAPWPSFSPLFGDVTQAFAPFLNQQVSVTYAGNPAIEREVVSDVASFGRQIGLLTDAVLVLAHGRDEEEIKALRKVAERVAKVKDRRKADAAVEARDALDALAKVDARALDRLLRTYPAPKPRDP
ncbi:hypothetical protein [Methylobacterium trifolii]|uniref:Uncharacterized protein n=1 Tax=Methylobacterium trifolii TaxID=1003092 RepID=A0ABQ4U0M3_9HYPH|nr:hypothetical protein [Methylobacterium trifolii]GJE61030.1 hypothetical protein MPOCJGCO_3151 [Methylobacterium trifolii]